MTNSEWRWVRSVWPGSWRSLLVPASMWLVASWLLAGCGPGGGTGPDDGGGNHGADCFVYVDDDFVGEEDGTEERPFNTIEEGIAAADEGCTVVLAAGTYGTRDSVILPRAINIVGAGMDSSFVEAAFELAMEPTTVPVRVSRLSCTNVFHAVHPDSGWIARAPVMIRECHLKTVLDTTRSVDEPFFYRLSGCLVDGDVILRNVSCKAARSVRDCTIGGNVELWQVTGDTCAVCDSRISGDLDLYVVAGERQTASGNEVGGSLRFYGSSIEEQTITGNVVDGDSLYIRGRTSHYPTISANTVSHGNILLELRSAVLTIEQNEVAAGGIRVICTAASGGTIRGNTVQSNRGETGIWLTSIAGPSIVGNIVAVPYAPPSGVPSEEDTFALCGIKAFSVSGPRISGNTVVGGSYGIYQNTVTGDVKYNTVTGAHTGIWAGAVACSLAGNEVTDCEGDGFAFGDPFGAGGVFYMEKNTASGNGAAGVRAFGLVHLGSADGRSLGGNTLTGNADFDLLVETEAALVGTIYARGNYWDHGTEAEIDEYDIWDGKDDPALAIVDFMPTGEGGGSLD